jgi:hypothetical protein
MKMKMKMKMNMQQLWDDFVSGKKKYKEKKLFPLPFCPPRVSHGHT